ncbi:MULTISPECIES: TonB-dependent receptor [unclassified Mucilaginibacter]|uniref:TonB-dependent receptor n=5 Tax=Mucilaginibacter TaxID=423349 RepID=UPI002AC90D58|nr:MULTISPECIES: TonB-dependent receptor [unclassified Mucilaginibacter]MEB0279312.1 TonB-dependent receptor [Mucilaginibacter sp. 10B2]WPX23176.1 TonB-dependent receptor [Mucilaginibacter sp. 5C4]
MKKIYLLLLLVSFLALTANSKDIFLSTKIPNVIDVAITGTIIDSVSGKPVDYATIAVFEQGTGKIVSGSMADAGGKFTVDNLVAGTYKLKITFIGYADKTVSNIQITEGGSLKLGKILLSPSATALKEVQVTAKKALIEEKIDRTVYNAENDLTARGGDATDVMKRVPMVSVDMDGNVSVRGSSNIKVLINGKPSAMMSASVSDALKQIPADLIKSVEVITSPSAKYDAEGSGGILNIVLKQNTLQGLSLNINTGLGTRGSDLGLNGGYKVGKFNFSLGGFGRSIYNTPGEFNNSQTITSLTTSDVRLTTQSATTKNKGLFGRYNFGVDYDINKQSSLSLGIVVGANNRPINQNNLFTQSYLNNMLSSSTLQNNNITNSSNQFDATLTYTLSGKKPEREFSLLAGYSQNNRDNNFESIFLDQSNLVTNGLKNINNSLNKEFTLEADYQTPTFKNQLLEFGVKNILRKVNSDYSSFSADDATLNYLPLSSVSLSNAFNYQQNVTAGYLSYTLALPKNYTVKAGARYEYTSINANFQTGSAVSIPNYSVLVPSFNIARKFDGGDMIKLGYNRRIQRPSLEFLNPNIQSSNPLNITVGNPSLQPEFTNNFELAYSTHIKNNSLNVSAFMRNTNDAIQTIRTSSGDTVRTSYQNLGRQNAYGMSLSVNISPINKLSINGGIDFYHISLDNQDPDPVFHASNSGWVANYRLFGSYDLSDKYSLQAFAFRRSNQVQLQGYQGGFGVYALSINRYFNGKKGSIGIGADNFLTNGFHIPTVVNSGNISQNAVNVNYNRSFEIKFSYKFGGLTNKPKKPKKTINNDDLKQDNNGGNN